MPGQVIGYPTTAKSTILFLLFLTFAFIPDLFFATLKLPLRLLSSTPPPPITLPTPIPPFCTPPVDKMSWFQKTLHLPSKSRGSYLITDTIVQQLPELKTYKVGILHLFVQHTSCALSMNENWDEDVRADMSDALDRIVPMDDGRKGLYRHDAEGKDDMPVSSILSFEVIHGFVKIFNTGTHQISINWIQRHNSNHRW
jgi:secondary thiamine-phosphate synthase enzyme